MSIVFHVSGPDSRKLAQLIGSKRHVRRQSSLDPFVLLVKPVEWLVDGFLWLLHWLVQHVMRQVSRLAVALFYGFQAMIQAMVLLLILLKEHMSSIED